MRRPIAAIAYALALITGAWFGQAYSLFASPGALVASDAHDRAAEAAVWRFYDAVDTLLRTGDTAGLLAVVAPDFVDHTARPGLPPTRDGLVRYLAALPQSFPDIRLTAGDLLVQDDRVVAQVALAGVTTGAFLGIPLAESLPWSSLDIFRVRGGQVVEHWADAQGLVVAEPLFSGTLTVPPGADLAPSLDRVSLAPGAIDARYQHGPAVVLAETGAVGVTLDNALTTLAPGEALTVPPGVYFAANNRSDVSADVVILRLKSLAWTKAAATPESSPETLPPGITAQPLAIGLSATVEPGPHTVAFGRISLAPGAQFASHRTAGPELLDVVEGAMTALFPSPSTRHWIYPSNPLASAASKLEILPSTSSLSVAPHIDVIYRNDDASVLSLLVVTILPVVPGTGSAPAAQPARL